MRRCVLALPLTGELPLKRHSPCSADSYDASTPRVPGAVLWVGVAAANRTDALPTAEQGRTLCVCKPTDLLASLLSAQMCSELPALRFQALEAGGIPGFPPLPF